MAGGRPAWFNTLIAAVLGLGALAFVALLAGFGSGVLTADDPDPSSALYQSGRDDGGPAPTGAPATGEAVLAITEVRFGDGGYVEIRNVGGAPADLDGWFLCQRPSYHGLGPQVLAPGEAVRVAPGAQPPAGDGVVAAQGGASIGSLRAVDGEMGLYDSGSFGDSASIQSYVEWGSSGHGRSSVAVGAGIWPDGGFVDSSGAAGIVAPGGAEDPGGWSTG